MNNLGCDLNQITVEIHNDGTELYIKRNVTINDVNTDLITRIKLVDKVTEHSSSATYHKKENNGELIFKMAQVIDDFVGEYDICEFTIEGDDSSTKDSLEIDISQTNETFVFTPKEKIKPSCRISASLENNALKYLISHDDVTSVKTIKIPVPIRPEQVEHSDYTLGKKITIHKSPHITQAQPNFVVKVSEI